MSSENSSYVFIPADPKNRTAYRLDLFNVHNNHLTASIRSHEERLLDMTLTRTLLKLLHEDISAVLTREPSAEFCFVNGFYMKGKDPSLKSHYSSFDPDIFEKLAKTGANGFSPNEQFFFKVANAIMEHMFFIHIDFLR